MHCLLWSLSAVNAISKCYPNRVNVYIFSENNNVFRVIKVFIYANIALHSDPYLILWKPHICCYILYTNYTYIACSIGVSSSPVWVDLHDPATLYTDSKHSSSASNFSHKPHFHLKREVFTGLFISVDRI